MVLLKTILASSRWVSLAGLDLEWYEDEGGDSLGESAEELGVRGAIGRW